MDDGVFLNARERISKGLFRASDNKFRCQYCDSFFSRVRDCVKHEKKYHKIQRVYSCFQCGEGFYETEALRNHLQKHLSSNSRFTVYKSLYGGNSLILRKNLDADSLEDVFTDSLRREVLSTCANHVIRKKRIYFSMSVNCVFLKFNIDGEVENKISFTASARRQELNSFQNRKVLFETYNTQMHEIDLRISDFLENGSNWSLSEVSLMDLQITSLSGMRGGCHFPYPTKRGLLNIKNEDDLCLIYCVIASFHSKSVPSKVKDDPKSYERFIKNFNIEGISFPMAPDSISLFEEKNFQLGFSVNVFIEIDDDVFQVRVANPSNTRMASENHIVNVLLVEGIDNHGERRYHYILIENPSKFIAKKYERTGAWGGSSYSNTLSCNKCFASFRSEEKKSMHESICGTDKKTKLVFRSSDESIEFSKPWLKFPHLFCGFVDFESALVKQEGDF